MRIAFYSDNFYPELSGITDSVMTLGEALVARGHQVLYAYPKYLERDYEAIGTTDHPLADGKNFFECRLPSLDFSKSATGHSRIALPIGGGLRALKKFKPDIIHTHSPFGTGIEALLDARLLGLPLVGTNHTPPSEFVRYSPIHTDWFKRLNIRFFSVYYNRCRFVSTPCQSLLDEMLHFGFRRPSRPLSNPIDLSQFRPAESAEKKLELKKRFGFSAHTILYTGRLAEEKCIDVIIRSLKEVLLALPDAELAITGHGQAESGLRQLVTELGLEKKVKFLGFVDKDIFPLLYRAADLFVIMSTAESQSLSMFQAMSSGLPVIGARARALPEYINEDCGRLVPVGEADKLAKEEIAILSDPELAKRLGQGGIERAKIATPNEVAAIWEKIYSDVIEKYAGKRHSKN